MSQFTFLPKTPADMVQEYAEVTKQESTEKLYKRLIEEEYIELFEEMHCILKPDINREDELKEISDLLYVLYGYARVRGYDLDLAVKRVHENNMGRMTQPDGTIKRRADGKIIKNPDYPAVDLGDLV